MLPDVFRFPLFPNLLSLFSAAVRELHSPFAGKVIPVAESVAGLS